MALDGGANGGPAVEAAMVLQCREGERCTAAAMGVGRKRLAGDGTGRKGFNSTYICDATGLGRLAYWCWAEIFRLHILMEVNVDPGTYYPWVHGFVYYTPISTKKHLYRWC